MERIRELRKERGLSQVKLAVMADMDPATLNRLERGTGNPNLKTLERVADALGVEVATLLPKAHGPSSPEPSLFNGLSGAGEGLNLNAAYWIENLNAQAELVEHMIDRGGYDLETIWTLEGAAVEFWGTYSRTMKRLVHEWGTEEQEQRLVQAETRMKEARKKVRKAYQGRRKTEPDRRVVDELEAKRRAREARHAREQDYADTGA
jgi:transcriptional regulator with XRE-family HTH domain